ncbi:hypothetical protein DMC25_06365 [Caulobacter sp. D4A]|uniref:hypothetical protein n=1 Tax=unclassified Caulobacter TaxID=2648921 RepID=UPI000D72A605|nr:MULTISPECIES: hypothetical protein [unclassified Caulobacter]PXA91173.1 hypothetical protein DMC25_06365 [Caulobacter sp. D4A]PXA96806.1 hypothetical protein DMC18_00655 [Caulobacter sp. D5]
MKTYVIYGTATGEILRVVVCLPALLPIQLQAGESALEVPKDTNTAGLQVVEGALTPIPDWTPPSAFHIEETLE